MARSITLSDEDYAALEADSATIGVPIEDLIHQAITERLSLSPPSASPSKQLGTYTYPTGLPPTEEEEKEMERLAQEIGSDKPWASDMVIEDRGPR